MLGFEADYGPSSPLYSREVPRGFDGVLRNVRYRGKLYDITSRADVGLVRRMAQVDGPYTARAHA